jgi:hypothetical protein
MIEELELADEAIVDSSDAEHDYEEEPEDHFLTTDEIVELRLRAENDDASDDDGTLEFVQGAPAHELPDDTRDGWIENDEA